MNRISIKHCQPYDPRWLFIFLAMYLGQTDGAFARKQVVVKEILVENRYAEYSNISIDDTTFIANLEKLVRVELGDVEFIYPGGRKISFADISPAGNFSETVASYQDQYKQYAETRNTPHDYLLDVRLTLSGKHINRKKRNGIQVVSKIIIKDANGKTIIRKSGKLISYLPDPTFQPQFFQQEKFDLVSSFPLRKDELDRDLTKSLDVAFARGKKLIEKAGDRDGIHDFDDFIKKAITYRILAHNKFTSEQYLKRRLFGLLTFAQKRTLLLTRVADHQEGNLRLQESKITDISIPIGVEELYTADRHQRDFTSSLEMKNIPQTIYQARAVFVNTSLLGAIDWEGKTEFKLIRKDAEGKGQLNFHYRGGGKRGIIKTTYILGRVFEPSAMLSGEVSGQRISVRSMPACYNALEVRLDDKLAAIIAHPVVPKKYLSKGNNLLPYLIHISPGVSRDEESLILQSFNLNALAYVIQNDQDNERNKKRAEEARPK